MFFYPWPELFFVILKFSFIKEASNRRVPITTCRDLSPYSMRFRPRLPVFQKKIPGVSAENSGDLYQKVLYYQ